MKSGNELKLMLGKIGENPPQSEFTNIINLNIKKTNFPIFDLIATKDNEIYAFSAKARMRYSSDLENLYYNILTGGYENVSRKFRKALDLFTEMEYDINKIHYCFLICPFEENKDCVYYWGEFTDIKEHCSMANILEKKIKFLSVPVSDKNLKNYKIYGIWNWEHIKNTYL